MKAIVCHEFAEVEKLALEEIAAPEVSADTMVINVGACGVNFPDALMVQGLYQVKPPFPFSPGLEVAGTVDQVGSNVSQFKPGDRVVALPGVGGYAEQASINPSTAFAIPDGISDSEAAALLVAYGTAHHALKQRANIQPGETLLVLGAAGGTGLAAVQIGKAMGAKVIAVCSSDDKLAATKQHGADELINYQQQDLKAAIKELTNGKGVDVVYDPIGGDAFDTCSRAMAWNGRLLVIGFASGRIPKLPINMTLIKGYSLVGVYWGEFTAREPELYNQNMQELFDWIIEGTFKPVIDSEWSLDDAVAALQKVTDRKAIGKLILRP